MEARCCLSLHYTKGDCFLPETQDAAAYFLSPRATVILKLDRTRPVSHVLFRRNQPQVVLIGKA